MKSIEFTNPGAYDVLKIVDAPIPQLSEGQLLVKVNYAAVNAVDNTVRSGIRSLSRSPIILGNEGVGKVVIGNDKFPQGTRVMISCFTPNGQVRGIYVNGLWQEYIALYPSEILTIDNNISDEEAAAFPVSFFSAQACLNKAGFETGKTVLSLAVGGGVGNAGIQLSEVQGASKVITTAGTSTKASLAESMGFKNVIDLSKESITEGVMRITDGKGVDIIIDSVGGKLTGDALSSLARKGVFSCHWLFRRYGFYRKHY